MVKGLLTRTVKRLKMTSPAALKMKKMRRLMIHLLAALLMFITGLSAHALWVQRQQIVDSCVEWLRNYQD